MPRGSPVMAPPADGRRSSSTVDHNTYQAEGEHWNGQYKQISLVIRRAEAIDC